MISSEVTPSKAAILAALYKFTAQRSGITFADYGERESFLQDYREVLRGGRNARALLRAIDLRESITAEDILAATRAFSGRLQVVTRDDGKVAIDYTTGQYFPTEYRAAVCAVCASALWAYYRQSMPVAAIAECPEGAPGVTQGTVNVGEYIRKKARREFGRGIQSRWFN